RALQARFAFVTEVRGKGLLAAMEFDGDLAGRVLTQANAAGVLLNAVRPNTVRFMPPLTITAEEIDEVASRLEAALTHIERGGGMRSDDKNMLVRLPKWADAPAITTIYNQGIEERIATFETELRTVEHIATQLAEKGDKYPTVVV